MVDNELNIGRQRFVLVELEITIFKHLLGEGGGISATAMEVLKHGPASPATHQLDVGAVHVGSEKSHAAAGAEGTGGDVFPSEIERGTNVIDSVAQSRGKLITGDVNSGV